MGQINIGTGKPHGFQHGVQLLSGRPGQGNPLFFFIQAGGVRYHHDVRPGIAGGKHGRFPQGIHVSERRPVNDQLPQGGQFFFLRFTFQIKGNMAGHRSFLFRSVRLYSVEDIPEFIAEGCFIYGIWRHLLRGGLLRPCFICGRLGVNGSGEGASGYPARVHDPFSQDHSGFLRDGGFLHAPG